MRPTVQFVTIPLSSAVSAAAIIKTTETMGVWVPTVTSGSWTIQAAYSTDAASADYVPALNAPPNSGAITLWWGAGSLSCALPHLAPFSAFRFVSSNPQAAVRSLAVFGKA